MNNHRSWFFLRRDFQFGQILFSTLYLVDKQVFNLIQIHGRNALYLNKFSASHGSIVRSCKQRNALLCRICPLVILPREKFCSEILLCCWIFCVNDVCNWVCENAAYCFGKITFGQPKNIINIINFYILYFGKNALDFSQNFRTFYIENPFFLYEDSLFHFLVIIGSSANLHFIR